MAAQVEKMLLGFAEKAPPKLAGPVRACAPVAAKVINGIDQAWPHVVKYYQMGSEFMKTVPIDLVYSIFGLCLCFFGGHFPLAIAAFEAFHQCGYERAKVAAIQLCDEFTALKVANQADNKKDDDGNGVADVHELTPTAFFNRKVNLFLISTENPEKMSEALGSLCAAGAGVLAALKLQFARTVALGVSIGSLLLPLAMRYVQPPLKAAVPEGYHKWLPTMIGFLCKSVAVSVAWTIQRVISCVQSASRGGLMFSRHGMKFLASKGLMAEINQDETMLDEFVGWGVACLGIWIQLRSWFNLPFPFWLLMMPVSICEYVLEWVITE